MAYIPQEKIDDMKSQADIVSLISEYVDLKQRGKNFIGLCPFHNEKTPSFTVSREKGIFHCFGCGEGGDIFSFIMKKEGLTYVEAIKFLADKLGIFLDTGKIDKEKYDYRKKLIQINEEAKIFFYKNLLVHDVPKHYIESRHLDKSLINKFMMGYADNQNSLLRYFSKKNVDKKDLMELGLISQSEDGRYYDKFRDRLMFPIFDTRNNCIGFGGRTLVGHNAKYMNSQQSLVYDKSRNIYGVQQLKNAASEGRLLLVEGYIDVIALSNYGIDCAIASLGTSLTLDQAKLISRYTKKIYICYDGDRAGIKATIRACEIFKEINIVPDIIQIPGGKDPDEYIQEVGKDAFELLIKNAKDPIIFRYDLLKDEYELSDVSQKLNFLDRLTDLLATIDREIIRAEYMKRFADDLEIEVEAVLEDVNQKRKVPKKVVQTEKSTLPSVSYQSREEKRLAFEMMKAMVFHPDGYHHLEKYVPYFENIEEFDGFIRFFEQKKPGDIHREEMEKYFSHDVKLAKVIDAVFAVKNKKDYSKDTFLEMLLKNLEKHRLLKQRDQLKEELEILQDNKDLDDKMQKRYRELLKEIMDLTKKLKMAGGIHHGTNR